MTNYYEVCDEEEHPTEKDIVGCESFELGEV